MSKAKHTNKKRAASTAKLEGMIKKCPYIITWESTMGHRVEICLDNGVEIRNGHTRLAFHLHTPGLP